MNPATQINLKSVLNRLFQGEKLTKAEAKSILTKIGKGGVDPFQIASFLTCFRMRPISGTELAGFREAMIELAINVDFSEFETIDLCGTGGDGKNTFNISTTASFVVAGAGFKVAKHGNYGVSSPCGSSNVLEYLGYQFTNDYDKLRRDIERANFCYMHAPLFHPAMKEVGPIRKGLQIKTFFNMLGPLLNPARPGQQLTGVFSTTLMPLYQEVFEDMGSSYAVIHSNDGYDEVSLTGPFQIRSNHFDGEVSLAELQFEPVAPEALHGGNTVEEAAKILTNILSGDGSKAQTDVVVVNAGLGIQRFLPETSLADCMARAQEAIDNGSALNKLRAAVG